MNVFEIKGGRKFQAFVLLYLGSTLMRVLELIEADDLVKLYIYIGGFYVGSNVLKAGVELAVGKLGKEETK